MWLKEGKSQNASWVTSCQRVSFSGNDHTGGHTAFSQLSTRAANTHTSVPSQLNATTNPKLHLNPVLTKSGSSSGGYSTKIYTPPSTASLTPTGPIGVKGQWPFLRSRNFKYPLIVDNYEWYFCVPLLSYNSLSNKSVIHVSVWLFSFQHIKAALWLIGEACVTCCLHRLQ